MLTTLTATAIVIAFLGVIMFASHMETRGYDSGFTLRKDKSVQTGPKNDDSETS